MSKKSKRVGVCAWFVLAVSISLSAASDAARIDFDNPSAITNGYTIKDYNRITQTQLSIDFTDTRRVLLPMTPSSILVNEFFALKLVNSTGGMIDKISFEFKKSKGVLLANKPSHYEWSTALWDKSDNLGVDLNHMVLSESIDSVNVTTPFLDNMGWNDGKALYLFQTWDLFNAPRTDWTLGINLNDSNSSDLIPTPIPSAIWVFASGLLGLVVAYRPLPNPSKSPLICNLDSD